MQCIAWHYIALHCITLIHTTYIHYMHTYMHYIALHYIALHCITLHYIALHCITLHYIALHCITLHTYIIMIHAVCNYNTYSWLLVLPPIPNIWAISRNHPKVWIDSLRHESTRLCRMSQFLGNEWGINQQCKHIDMYIYIYIHKIYEM